LIFCIHHDLSNFKNFRWNWLQLIYRFSRERSFGVFTSSKRKPDITKGIIYA
jgi:hypothetical protein